MTTREHEVLLWGGLGNQLYQMMWAQRLASMGERVRVHCTGATRFHDRVGVLALNFNPEVELSGYRIPATFPRWLTRAIYRVDREAQTLLATVVGDDHAIQWLKGQEISPKRRLLWFGQFSSAENVTRGLEFSRPTLSRPSVWYEQSLRQIHDSDAAALHLRRGDFRLAQDLLDADYYAAAMKVLKIQESDPMWIFSDEPGAAVELVRALSLTNATVVRPPPRSPAAESLLLMSSSPKIIAANSTYSWWAARLSHGSSVLPTHWDRATLRAVATSGFENCTPIAPTWE